MIKDEYIMDFTILYITTYVPLIYMYEGQGEFMKHL